MKVIRLNLKNVGCIKLPIFKTYCANPLGGLMTGLSPPTFPLYLQKFSVSKLGLIVTFLKPKFGPQDTLQNEIKYHLQEISLVILHIHFSFVFFIRVLRKHINILYLSFFFS